MEYSGIIVGLGNPGPKFVGTRHNLGFEFIDYIINEAQNNSSLETMSGAKYKCDLWRCKLFNAPHWWLLAKPLTFMNLSGECVQPLLAWHKLKPSQLIVAHDELDITVGTLRFKTGGGNAGHNGLKSITEHLGTPDFHRMRIGIGRPSLPNQDVASYVLTRPSSEESPLLEQSVKNALKVLNIFYKEDSKQASKLALSLRSE